MLTILLMLWRYTCRIVVKVTRGHGRNARRVIIVGSKDNAVEVYHEMVDNTSTGYRVLGYFSNHDDHTLPDNTPCLGSVDEALPWLEAHPVNEVYCCLSTDRYAEEIFPIMDFLRKQLRPLLLRAQPAQLHEAHDEPRTAGQRTDPLHPRGAVAAGVEPVYQTGIRRHRIEPVPLHAVPLHLYFRGHRHQTDLAGPGALPAGAQRGERPDVQVH